MRAAPGSLEYAAGMRSVEAIRVLKRAGAQVGADGHATAMARAADSWRDACQFAGAMFRGDVTRKDTKRTVEVYLELMPAAQRSAITHGWLSPRMLQAQVCC